MLPVQTVRWVKKPMLRAAPEGMGATEKRLGSDAENNKGTDMSAMSNQITS